MRRWGGETPEVGGRNSSSSTFLLCTCGRKRSKHVSADTPKGFPLALWNSSGHAVGVRGRKTPSGSTGMSSAAIYGSATDDPVHPSRESFAPFSNNVHAKEKRGNERGKTFIPLRQTVHAKRNEEAEKRADRSIIALLAQKKNGEREIGIRYYHILSQKNPSEYYLDYQFFWLFSHDGSRFLPIT